MSNTKQLLKQKHAIEKQINAIARKREADEMAKLEKTLPGKCYRYPNSFSGGEKFWSYMKVTRVLDVMIRDWLGDKVAVSVEGIQIDDHRDTLGICRVVNYLSTWEDYPISPAEFEKVYQRVLKELA